jgi:DNA-binding IclR family transcriptional regulator
MTAGTQAAREQSVGRAATLLRLVAAHGVRGARLLDLAERSGIARPTVHRILRRLCDERLLAQDKANKRYVMGSLMFELGLAARTPVRRLERMRPALEALAESTGDTVYLVMRTGDEAVCLHLAEGHAPIRTRTFEPGARRPLGTGAAGLALLAALPEDDARAVITRNHDRLQHLGLSEPMLLQRMQRARQGGAVSHGTITDGVTGISVVVPAQAGIPYLAVSVGAISTRMPEERIQSLWNSLNTTARRLAVIEVSGG